MHRYLLITLFLALVLCTPIPKTKGYSIGNPAAPIEFQVFIVLTCPDCKTSFFDVLVPTIRDYVSTNKVRLVLTHFPLPFHMSAYDLSTTANVVSESIFKNDPEGYLSFLSNAFSKQALFSNAKVINMTFSERRHFIYKELVSSFGLAEDSFNALFDADKTTRIHWKSGAARSVAGTPWYFVNGIALEGGEEQTFADFQKLFNELLH
ncbi:hypothetical protein RCL1_001795 [Eukaryota sp. TZLM3-RCL]